jgi:hypothetical protein
LIMVRLTGIPMRHIRCWVFFCNMWAMRAGAGPTAALQGLEAAFGPDHPALCEFLDRKAEVAQLEDRLTDAQALFERSLAIKNIVREPRAPAPPPRPSPLILDPRELVSLLGCWCFIVGDSGKLRLAVADGNAPLAGSWSRQRWPLRPPLQPGPFGDAVEPGGDAGLCSEALRWRGAQDVSPHQPGLGI